MLDDIRQRMRRFECRQNTFGLGYNLERFQHFVIGSIIVADAPDLVQIAMLRTYACVVEPGGNRVSALDLTVSVCQQIPLRTLNYTQPAALKASGMLSRQNTSSTCLDPDHGDIFIRQKR